MEEVAVTPTSLARREPRIEPWIDDAHIHLGQGGTQLLRSRLGAGRDTPRATQATPPERTRDEVGAALVGTCCAVLRESALRQLVQPDDEAPAWNQGQPLGERQHDVEAARRLRETDLLPRDGRACADDLERCVERNPVLHQRDHVGTATRERLNARARHAGDPFPVGRDGSRVEADPHTRARRFLTTAAGTSVRTRRAACLRDKPRGERPSDRKKSRRATPMSPAA